MSASNDASRVSRPTLERLGSALDAYESRVADLSMPEESETKVLAGALRQFRAEAMLGAGDQGNYEPTLPPGQAARAGVAWLLGKATVVLAKHGETELVEEIKAALNAQVEIDLLTARVEALEAALRAARNRP